MGKSLDEIADFKARVVFNNQTGCWIWSGATNGRYGRIGDRYAHRRSHELFVGALEPGAHVCHRCDTPLCVNPDHIYAGTAQTNMRDRACRNFDHPIAIGQHHWNAKLSPEQVDEIRTSTEPSTALASRYGVGARQIRRVRQGVRWTESNRGAA